MADPYLYKVEIGYFITYGRNRLFYHIHCHMAINEAFQTFYVPMKLNKIRPRPQRTRKTRPNRQVPRLSCGSSVQLREKRHRQLLALIPRMPFMFCNTCYTISPFLQDIAFVAAVNRHRIPGMTYLFVWNGKPAIIQLERVDSSHSSPYLLQNIVGEPVRDLANKRRHL